MRPQLSPQVAPISGSGSVLIDCGTSLSEEARLLFVRSSTCSDNRPIDRDDGVPQLSQHQTGDHRGPGRCGQHRGRSPAYHGRRYLHPPGTARPHRRSCKRATCHIVRSRVVRQQSERGGRLRREPSIIQVSKLPDAPASVGPSDRCQSMREYTRSRVRASPRGPETGCGMAIQMAWTASGSQPDARRAQSSVPNHVDRAVEQ